MVDKVFRFFVFEARCNVSSDPCSPCNLNHKRTIVMAQYTFSIFFKGRQPVGSSIDEFALGDETIAITVQPLQDSLDDLVGFFIVHLKVRRVFDRRAMVHPVNGLNLRSLSNARWQMGVSLHAYFSALATSTYVKDTIPVQVVQGKEASQVKGTNVVFRSHMLLHVGLLSLGMRCLAGNACGRKLPMKVRMDSNRGEGEQQSQLSGSSFS